jgi:hypothetical protein
LRLRHLPILGRLVIIEILPKRFRCPTCDNHPTTTHKLDWDNERSLHTVAYDQWLLLQLIGSTISDSDRRETFQCSHQAPALRRNCSGYSLV